MLQVFQQNKNVSQVMQVPVNEPWLRGNEEKYVLECVRSGWISSEGSFVKKFEEDFAKNVDRSYGVAVSNGSVALDVAMQALQISEGAEVILPTFTIISCAAAIVRAGAVPVLVDCNSLTWNMDVAQIEAKITSRTKAIMMVHIYGLPVDVEPLLALAKKYNLYVIEDAAEMIGQTYAGKSCGSFGDISTFSFYANKHITTGEGGMVVVNDLALAERARAARNLFFQPARRYVHEELGNNFRLTNLQAAIGLAQLECLQSSVAKKRQMGRVYSQALADLQEHILLPLPQTAFAENIYWVYGIVVKNPKIKVSELLGALAENGIGTRTFFWPMHLQPVFTKKGLFKNESYPEAEFIARQGFYIPSGLALSDEKIAYVINTLRRLINERI